MDSQKPVGVVVVAGTSSGVGKTTLAVGLMAALRCGHKFLAFAVRDANIKWSTSQGTVAL